MTYQPLSRRALLGLSDRNPDTYRSERAERLLMAYGPEFVHSIGLSEYLQGSNLEEALVATGIK